MDVQPLGCLLPPSLELGLSSSIVAPPSKKKKIAYNPQSVFVMDHIASGLLRWQQSSKRKEPQKEMDVQSLVCCLPPSLELGLASSIVAPPSKKKRK